MSIEIRTPELHESKDVLRLMIGLAEFESYIHDFKVTEKELIQRLFKNQDFNVLVASVDGKLMGILTYYYLPFTYDLRPWMIIKELFVEPAARSQQLGGRLMARAAAICIENNGSKIKWDVLNSNEAASKFYRQLGAKADEEWQGYYLSNKALAQLASSDDNAIS